MTIAKVTDYEFWYMKGFRRKDDIDIAQELEKQLLYIFVLSETKKKSNGTESLEKYSYLYRGVDKREHVKRGVWLLVKKYKKP